MDPDLPSMACALQLMRKILDTRGHGYQQLKGMVETARAGQRVVMEMAVEGGNLAITPEQTDAEGQGNPEGQPVLQLSQEGAVLPPPRGKRGRKSTGAKPSGKDMKLPLQMAEELLQEYEEVLQQQQQQQEAAANGAGSSAAAAAAAAAAGGPSAAIDCSGLLPKEAFVLQLVHECCGPARCADKEKVVVFTQVGWRGCAGCGRGCRHSPQHHT